MSNIEIAQGAYDAFAVGDIQGVLAIMTSDCHWSEAAGMPFGGEFQGPDAVLAGIFQKIPEKFETFGIEIEQLFGAGDRAVMVGRYKFTSKHSPAEKRARAIHVITFRDGKMASFVQCGDSAIIRDSLG